MIAGLLNYLQISEVAVEGQVFIVDGGEAALVSNISVN